MTEPAAALLLAVREGRHDDVPELLKSLDAAERKAVLSELKALRAEVRGWDWNRWNERTRVQRALRIAGAGCHTGAAAAAAWIGGRDLSDGGPAWQPVLSVLADRDPVWLGGVAQRLAERPAVAEGEYPLVRELVVRSGCAVPTTDGYVLGWTRHVTDSKLLVRLRADPQTPVLVPRAIEMAETPDRLTWSVGPESPTHWPTAVKALADEGVLDRAALVDACVARLLRGGRPRDLRFALALLQLLEPTAQERQEQRAEWIGMAGDAPSSVAAYAQGILAGLAAEGALSVRDLAEMSGPVLFRTEKKLVRAQLTLLGKVLRQEPAQAAELLPVVAEAFGHEDTGLQERALKLVGRHLSAVDEQVRVELAGAAALLSPVHHQAARELFGDAPADGEDAPYEETLPPVPELRPVAAPAETIAELVEDLVALSKGRTHTAEEFERALGGLIRHAHRDRAALREAVRTAFAGAYWTHTHVDGRRLDTFVYDTHGIDVVLAALLGTVPESRIDAGRARDHGSATCAHTALGGAVDARLWEAAHVITTGRLPFLLAAPSWHTGALAPSVLVERLRVYRDSGVAPAPADLAQALLRVRKADASAREAAAGAAALGTLAGERLSEWLTREPPLAPRVRFLPRGRDMHSGRWWLDDRLENDTPARPVAWHDFPPAFRWLGSPLAETAGRCHHGSGDRQNWASVLPDDRETLAAWLLPTLARSVEWDGRGAAEDLTALAEADGPVGPALHLALALGLGCRHAEDRLTAVDALLVLAARGELDAERLGATLAGLVDEGTVKANRLAEAVRTAAATGAYATTWSVLAGALPELLAAGRPVHGLGELLAVAADCAERCGATGEIPGLGATAARRGSSQLLVQARRLGKALQKNAPGNRSDRDTTG
ncbi:hypothetical protein J7E93_20435 [Streptomyces sp. ISL-36]|nr:hypothetical protein [Streptomyces sp. ISL-36]